MENDNASDKEFTDIFIKTRGYSVLLPDLRASGKSEGKYIGMGWLDRADIKRWVEYINNNYPNKKIILYGVSMGAATVMMSAGENLKNVVYCKKSERWCLNLT